MLNRRSWGRDMKSIKDTYFEGERPLFASQGLYLENVQFYPGESALKEAADIEAKNCNFMCKYPFWHNANVKLMNCHFEVYARAAMWYCSNLKIESSKIEAPKAVRECTDLIVENSSFLNSDELGWNCSRGIFNSIEITNADYAFMNCRDLSLSKVSLSGNYTFQYTKSIEVHESNFDTKDAFWHSENVTVYNSVLKGHYLGWYSKNLRLVNCKIIGEQPLCYAENLILENCEMVATDLCFEYSSLKADVCSTILSVKNPLSGSICCKSIGEIIWDENCRNRGDCEIIESDKRIK